MTHNDPIANIPAGDVSQNDRMKVERIIREALPGLMVEEYGETERDWTELRSVSRIARALAERVTSPASPTSGEDA